jgi:uncharacterized membrane protein
MLVTMEELVWEWSAMVKGRFQRKVLTMLSYRILWGYLARMKQNILFYLFYSLYRILSYNPISLMVFCNFNKTLIIIKKIKKKKTMSTIMEYVIL